MFLGNAQSSPDNIQRRLHNREGVLNYPPTQYVTRYERMSDPRIDARIVTLFVGQVPSMLPLPYLGYVIDAICEDYVTEHVHHWWHPGGGRARRRRAHASRRSVRGRLISSEYTAAAFAIIGGTTSTPPDPQQFGFHFLDDAELLENERLAEEAYQRAIANTQVHVLMPSAEYYYHWQVRTRLPTFVEVVAGTLIPQWPL